MSKFPEHLYLEWHPTKNEKPLDEYALYSKYQAFWVCSVKPHHEWQTRLAHRISYNTGCPYCSNRIVIKGENDLASQRPELLKEWSVNNTVKPDEIVYGYAKKVWWECSEGHNWDDTVSNRTLLGRGCPYCNHAKPVIGENDLATLYPHLADEWSNKNDYKPHEVLPKSNKKPIWVCNSGHEWVTSIAHRTSSKPSGCPYCTNQKVLAGFNDFATTHAGSLLLKEWSKNNLFKPKDIPAGSTKKVIWKCLNNHEWETQIKARLRGYGCPYCANRFLWKGFNDLATTHPDLAEEWSPRNQLKADEVVGAKDEKVWWVCSEGHEWEQNIWGRKSGKGCPACNKITSTPEREIKAFLKQFNFEVKHNDRKLLKGLEVDFYIPEKNLAIEFNGLYWHSEARGKGQNYHYNKWLKCKEQGVQLIQVWGDDWNRNPELVKEMLKAKMGESTQSSVYARDTYVDLVSVDDAREFMRLNHIQGWYNGSYYVGLRGKSDGMLVALCIVKKEAGSGGKVLNIIRYATSCKVAGGFTKILSHVERTYKPEQVITFSDNMVSDGGLYVNNGFHADKEIRPDYQYLVKNERVHKFNYRLARFRSDPNLIYVDGLTERELAELNGLDRIWDAGKTRWVKSSK